MGLEEDDAIEIERGCGGLLGRLSTILGTKMTMAVSTSIQGDYYK